MSDTRETPDKPAEPDRGVEIMKLMDDGRLPLVEDPVCPQGIPGCDCETGYDD